MVALISMPAVASQQNQIQPKFKPSDHFKLLFQTIAADFDQVKHILEKFLKDVIDHKTFRNHNETVSRGFFSQDSNTYSY